MIINTILAEGQAIHSRVLNGITANGECSLKPIVSYRPPGTHARQNRFHNWARAIEINKQDIFCMIDSDIILPECAILKVKSILDKFSIVVWPSMSGSQSHGLWAMRRNVLNEIPLKYMGEKKCSICPWLLKLEEQYDMYRISDSKLEEVKQ